jgi:lysine 2,3-aminomutase
MSYSPSNRLAPLMKFCDNCAMKTIRSIAQLKAAGIIKSIDSELDAVEQHFATAISPEMVSSIVDLDDSDPVYRQFVPSQQELIIKADERLDPIGDQSHSPVAGVVHRHQDRCLLMPVNVCAVYCRFCFRRDLIGPGKKAMTGEQLERAYAYIAEHEDIWEVILTGGDPLIMKPKQLAQILRALRQIKHVKVIRIHSRIPVVDPGRITDELLALLFEAQPCYLVLHANCAQEFSLAAKSACQKIVSCGIPMLSQSVLLKGVNDQLEPLIALMRQFVELGIKPYYIHQLDKARGISHFEVPIARGRELMTQLRQAVSGLCQPAYVIDAPGGTHGKQLL